MCSERGYSRFYWDTPKTLRYKQVNCSRGCDVLSRFPDRTEGIIPSAMGTTVVRTQLSRFFRNYFHGRVILPEPIAPF